MKIRLQVIPMKMSFCFAKPTLILLFVFISVSSLLISATHHIKQDSTGNFITIQEGIIAATDSDTVLVYPGTYYENIDYLEKSLTVASLYIITPEDSLINQTIIDGNQQLRCVKIDECEEATILGFTIQNGVALQEGISESYQGGGVFIKETNYAEVSNCKIRDNISVYGGGICVINSEVYLKGNTISYNMSNIAGGGLLSAFITNSNYHFDDVDLNNVYLNYSATGSDIFLAYYDENTNVIIDTFSVFEPDYFYLNHAGAYSFSSLNSKIEEINQDLYVGSNGDDNNSGLTPYDPLQTIAWAQTLIKRNDVNPNTIHLDSGIYSPSLNNQIYPLNVKHGVIIKGISPEDTILDAELESPFFHHASRYQNEFAQLFMENVKMINGDSVDDPKSGGINIYQADLYLHNVIFENCYGYNGGAICTSNGFANLNRVIVINNYGAGALSFSIEYNCPNPVRDVKISNSILSNNHPSVFDPDFYAGCALQISGHSTIIGDFNAQLINCEITENLDSYYNPQTGLGGSSGLYMGNNIQVDIVNSTLGDNTLSATTGCVISVVNNSELNLYNTILYNNDGYSFNLWEDAVVNISHSLIEGGDDNVNYYYPLAIVNWIEGNLDEDPYWDVDGDNPYALLGNSPCINAGTLDLPNGIELPEFDLAGNPRIYGETIDMGAYEFQEDPQSNDENEIVIPEVTQISNYPNPFNPSTTIKLDLAESGKIELAIYNIKGQKVKTLLDAYSTKGHFEIIWQGIDDNNDKVASGQYFIRLKVDGEEKAVRKCILLK